MSLTVKLLTTSAALATALALSACAGDKPPPPAAPPAPPPLALSSDVIQNAALYQGYVDNVSSLSPDFKSGADVAKSLSLGDGYDPQKLLRGEIAFAAIAALQDPIFVASVRTYAVNPSGRQQMVAAIVSDPAYATGIKGADSAAGLIVAALMSHGQKMVQTGAAMKQAAYKIQHDAWSKEIVVNREGRLENAKSGVMPASSAEEVSRLQSAALGASRLEITGQPVAPPYTPVVARGLAVAALAVLGEAGEENNALMAPLFTDAASTNCLNMAKMNLYQCLAVSRPHYEDVFCLGQHVLADTGQCLMIDAGAPLPPVEAHPVSKTETAYGAPAPPSKKKHHKKG